MMTSKSICKAVVSALLAIMLLPLTAGAQPDNVTLAKMAWGEARGESKTEQAATMWTVLNRVDSDQWADNVYSVVTQPNQFTGYRRSNPVDPELLALADDVLERWTAEHNHWKMVGRVLPKTCYYFIRRGGHNVFGYEYPIKDTYEFGTMEEVNPYEEEIQNAETVELR